VKEQPPSAAPPGDPERETRENDEDRALVTRFLVARDDAAFRALYRRHAPATYRFATRLAGTTAVGEDLHQESWIRAVERLASFRGESSLRTWLCGVVLNRWREIRRSGTETRAPAPPGGFGAEDEEAIVETTRPIDEATRIDLERAVLALPDGYREVFVLHDLYGYTHDQIAQRIGIEPGTSKSQLSRARRTLRERLRGVPRETRNTEDTP
jgi:RNA polymerase sigma-70 factor (ECF subfamily)